MSGKAALGGHQRHQLGMGSLQVPAWRTPGAARHRRRHEDRRRLDLAERQGTVPEDALTERAVRAAITELTGLGELVVEDNAGPGGCNRYRVITAASPCKICRGAKFCRGKKSAPLQNLPPLGVCAA